MGRDLVLKCMSMFFEQSKFSIFFSLKQASDSYSPHLFVSHDTSP